MADASAVSSLAEGAKTSQSLRRHAEKTVVERGHGVLGIADIHEQPNPRTALPVRDPHELRGVEVAASPSGGSDSVSSRAVEFADCERIGLCKPCRLFRNV